MARRAWKTTPEGFFDFTAGSKNRALGPEGIKYIVLHDVSGNPLDRRLPNIENIKDYHFVFDKSGIVQHHPLDREANHAANFNERSIGVAHRGFEGDPLSPEAIANGQKLFAWLREKFPNAQVGMHPEFGPDATNAPGGKDRREASWARSVLPGFESKPSREISKLVVAQQQRDQAFADTPGGLGEAWQPPSSKYPSGIAEPVLVDDTGKVELLSPKQQTLGDAATWRTMGEWGLTPDGGRTGQFGTLPAEPNKAGQFSTTDLLPERTGRFNVPAVGPPLRGAHGYGVPQHRRATTGIIPGPMPPQLPAGVGSEMQLNPWTSAPNSLAGQAVEDGEGGGAQTMPQVGSMPQAAPVQAEGGLRYPSGTGPITPVQLNTRAPEPPPGWPNWAIKAFNQETTFPERSFGPNASNDIPAPIPSTTDWLQNQSFGSRFGGILGAIFGRG